MTDQLDRELVEKIKIGNGEAFTDLYNTHKDAVFNLSIGILKNKEDAEEAVNDTFLRVYKKLYTYKGDSKFSSWLYRITFNSATMLYRSRKTRVTTRADLNEDVLGNLVDYDLLNEDFLLRDKLIAMIDSLSPVCRHSFVEYAVNERMNKDVAEDLGICLAAAKSRVWKARLDLKRAVDRTIQMKDFTHLHK